jgi:hypothetical protein
MGVFAPFTVSAIVITLALAVTSALTGEDVPEDDGEAE